MNPHNPKQDTQFLPAERSTRDSLIQDFSALQEIPFFKEILNTIPEGLLILNHERQIVFCNTAFLEKVKIKDIQDILGVRLGEALQCIHSDETPGGCGTTEFCRDCGAPKALIMATMGKRGEAECRISQKSGEALDIKVWTSKFEVEGNSYMSFAITDISDTKRRRSLERLFFHDILNTAGNLQGVADLFEEAPTEQNHELMKLVRTLSEELIDEIESQREIALAESGELDPKPEVLDSLEILETVVFAYRHHPACFGKKLMIDPESESAPLRLDKTLIRRVVGNMIMNALEASSEGDCVDVGAAALDGVIQFWVHNPAVMSDAVRHQVFQRSFSTKGAGRGLGTYSIKLLVERYMNGTASFSSNKDKGTRFTVDLPLDTQVC